MKLSDKARWLGGEHHHTSFYDRTTTVTRTKNLVKQVLRSLRKRYPHVCLVGTGISGALLVPDIAGQLDVPFVLLRERGARPVAWSSKCGGRLVGVLEPHAIFVDDLVSEGRTIRRVYHLLKKEGSVLVGAVMRSKWAEGSCQSMSDGTSIPVWTV